MPDELPAVDAAPLLCAGITTYNALRNSGARPGDVVGILGLGGLGHLGVQFAAKMGFQTIAIARGSDKAPLAKQLGASSYIDSVAQDPAAELQKLGGAKVILSTVTVGDAMSALVDGLGTNGTLILVGVASSMDASPLSLIQGRRSIKGWYSGTAMDSQDTLAFSARTGVKSMNEIYPLDRVGEAYDRMMSGKARFRVVLTIGSSPECGPRNSEKNLRAGASRRSRPHAASATSLCRLLAQITLPSNLLPPGPPQCVSRLTIPW